MCIPRVLEVKSVYGKRAVMENRQVVDISRLKNIKKGDMLEVYGPLALCKKRRRNV